MNTSPEAEIANLNQDLELAYISIATQKTYIANVDLENAELSKRNAELLQRISYLEKEVKSYRDSQDARDREEAADLRELQEDGYCRGIGGGHGY